MALLPLDHLRTSRFWLSFSGSVTRDQLHGAINPSETPATDGLGQLIALAVAWVGKTTELPNDSLGPMMTWCLARDVVGALAAIDDLAFYADPSLLRSDLESRPVEAILRDWIENHADWHAAVGYFCAERRREVLVGVAGSARDEKELTRRM